METPVPETLGDYTPASIEQQINDVINGLIDLGGLIKKEAQEPTL